MSTGFQPSLPNSLKLVLSPEAAIAMTKSQRDKPPTDSTTGKGRICIEAITESTMKPKRKLGINQKLAHPSLLDAAWALKKMK